jgi:hypothetical protein
MGGNAIGASHWEKGSQMRKGMFLAGVAVGFVAGTRAGRDTYDKMVAYARQVIEHPKVQQATSTVQAKTADLTKQAAAKAPDYAKGAMSSVQTTVSTQVPKFVQNVRQTATDRMPSVFARSGGGTASSEDPATDGRLSGQPDDVAPDGNLVYPADDGTASTGGRARVTPDTP